MKLFIKNFYLNFFYFPFFTLMILNAGHVTAGISITDQELKETATKLYQYTVSWEPYLQNLNDIQTQEDLHQMLEYLSPNIKGIKVHRLLILDTLNYCKFQTSIDRQKLIQKYRGIILDDNQFSVILMKIFDQKYANDAIMLCSILDKLSNEKTAKKEEEIFKHRLEEKEHQDNINQKSNMPHQRLITKLKKVANKIQKN